MQNGKPRPGEAVAAQSEPPCGPGTARARRADPRGTVSHGPSGAPSDSHLRPLPRHPPAWPRPGGSVPSVRRPASPADASRRLRAAHRGGAKGPWRGEARRRHLVAAEVAAPAEPEGRGGVREVRRVPAVWPEAPIFYFVDAVFYFIYLFF